MPTGRGRGASYETPRLAEPSWARRKHLDDAIPTRRAAGPGLPRAAAANFPPSRCDLKDATYLQIYPPNQTTPVYLKYKAQACAKPVQILTVSVVKAGSGGS